MSDIRSTVTITRRGPELVAELLGRAVKGQNLAAERLLGLSLEQIPMDEGDLAGSGQVVNAEQPGDDALVVYDRPQAARLHEHPEYNFAKDANPGAKGKYLEDPAMQNRNELGEIIAKEAGRA